LLTSLPKFAII